MGTVRAGAKSALLVVDMQVGVLENKWNVPAVLAQVQAAVERARASGVPVVWVQHQDEELVPGTPAWQWAAPLAPAAGETVVPKRYNSGFEDTVLEATLAQLGASHVVLAGAATNWCIRATAYAALERGYDLTLVQDAHTTRNTTLRDGTVIEAAQIVAELNAVLGYLEYPGRRSAVVALKDWTH